MKKIIIFIIGVLIVGSLFYFTKTGVSCSGSERLEKSVDGDSMSPLFDDGGKIDLLVDYYDVCKKQVSRGDIIAYNYGGNELALIKVVKVNDSDTLSFSGSKMKVNGKILSNSAGEEYSFSENELNMLKMYIVDGKIPKESFLIFGDNVTNSIDSRKFGAVSQSDFLGKFDL